MTDSATTPDQAGARIGNREKLLRAAMTCLREKGYAATTARDLASVSGANLASIGYHFGSKEALLNEAVAEGTRLWMCSVEAEVYAAGPASAPVRFERSLAAVVDRFDELEPFLNAFVEAFPPALRSEPLRQSMAAAYEEVRATGAEMFERMLAEDGEEIDRATARVLSSTVIALTDGLILQWLLEPEKTPSSTEIVEALRTAAAFSGGF